MPKIIDLAGNRYGTLIVVNFSHIENHRTWWNCKCDCGNIIIRRSEVLKRGGKQSCGCIKSLETSNRFKGKKLSDEHKKKISDAAKSSPCKIAGWNKGVPRSKEAIEKFSLKMKGRKRPPFSKEWREKIGKAGIGRTKSKEERDAISERFKGEKCHLWKGGVTPKHKLIRSSREYVAWRKLVFERDDWTCIYCGKRGGNLEAHHKKPFYNHPEHRFDIDNGETLCIPCHNKTRMGRST